MKHIFSILRFAPCIILLFLWNGSISVYASSDENLPMPENTIVSLKGESELSDIPEVIINKGDAEALEAAIAGYIFVWGNTYLQTGEMQELRLQVAWDLENLKTDLSTPGKYLETADILASEGYVFGENVLQKIVIPVTVVETAAESEIVTYITDISHNQGYALAKDSNWDTFYAEYFYNEKWRNYVPCRTESGNDIYAHIEWADPKPDTSQTGVVKVAGRILLPENTVLAEGITMPEVYHTISIQDPESPALDCWYLAAGNLCLPCIYMDETEDVRVLVKKNEEDWIEDPAFFYYNNGAVYLWRNEMAEDAYYEVKAVWEEVETGIFHFVNSQTITDFGYREGDRDGGDAGKNNLPDVIQPPPEIGSQPNTALKPEVVPSMSPQPEPEPKPETKPGTDTGSEPEIKPGTDTGSEPEAKPEADTGQEPERKPLADAEPGPERKPLADAEPGPETKPEADTGSGSEIKPEADTGPKPGTKPEADTGQEPGKQQDPFLEEITDTYSLLSAARVKLMNQSGKIRFSKQGVTVSLSAAAMEERNLADSSQFYIEILALEKGFSVAVKIDGNDVSEFADTTVFVPYTNSDENQKFVLEDETGKKVSEGIYDAALGVVSFTIHTTGEYTITEPEEKSENRAVDTQNADIVQPDAAVQADAAARSDSAVQADTAGQRSILFTVIAGIVYTLIYEISVLFRRWF